MHGSEGGQRVLRDRVAYPTDPYERGKYASRPGAKNDFLNWAGRGRGWCLTPYIQTEARNDHGKHRHA